MARPQLGGSEGVGAHLHAPRTEGVVAGSGWTLPAPDLCRWVRASHPHPIAAASGKVPTPPCPGVREGLGMPRLTREPRCPRGIQPAAPWDRYPHPLWCPGELTRAQPFLRVTETCAGSGSPWLSADLGFQRSTGNGRWISRQTGLSINSLRGRPTTAGAVQSQGWALQLFIAFFCSSFLPSSAARGSSSPA